MQAMLYKIFSCLDIYVQFINELKFFIRKDNVEFHGFTNKGIGEPVPNAKEVEEFKTSFIIKREVIKESSDHLLCIRNKVFEIKYLFKMTSLERQVSSPWK